MHAICTLCLGDLDRAMYPRLLDNPRQRRMMLVQLMADPIIRRPLRLSLALHRSHRDGQLIRPQTTLEITI